ncbi:MAG: response regulator [Bacteroidota bacterium]
MTILLIDDDETTNFFNELLIKTHIPTAHVQLAVNGLKALQYLQQHPMPNIILLDINMPVMDGFEFLTESKSLPGIASALIAMLTTSLNANDLKIARDHPEIKKFINKPLRVEDLTILLEMSMDR